MQGVSWTGTTRPDRRDFRSQVRDVIAQRTAGPIPADGGGAWRTGRTTVGVRPQGIGSIGTGGGGSVAWRSVRTAVGRTALAGGIRRGRAPPHGAVHPQPGGRPSGCATGRRFRRQHAWTHAHPPRNRRAARPSPAADSRGRGDLGAGLLRAWRGLRPRRPSRPAPFATGTSTS